MLGYVTIGTNDLDKAAAFYDAVLAPLDGKRMMPLERGVIFGATRPCLGLIKPFDGQPAAPGNGAMAALMAPTRAAIQAAYAKALELGGVDEGAPGVRGDDPNGFYAAYFRDLDGNKLCVFRMGPPEA